MDKGDCKVGAGMIGVIELLIQKNNTKHANYILFQEIILGILLKLDNEFNTFYNPNLVQFKRTNWISNGLSSCDISQYKQ